MRQISKNIIYLLLFSSIFISCGVSHRQKAEEIIQKFEQNEIPDKRETVFSAEAVFEKGKIIIKGETDSRQLKDKLLNNLREFDVTDEIVLLPDSSAGKNTFALVNVSAANFRVNPGYGKEMATQATVGTPVKILKRQNGWYLVQTPDNYVSWAPSGGLFPVSENELINWRNSERVIFTESFTQVYETAVMENPVADVTMGGILQLTEKQWNYIKVRFPDGREGYTDPQNWISFSEFKNSAQPDSLSVTSLAQNLTGRPYLWGGTTALALDCSGFTKLVYFMHGIILARDASLQVRHGELINTDNTFENLQQGDLLFFGQKADENRPEKITHIAISLGNTEYIHASGKIQQNSFDNRSTIFSEHRKSSFIRARRIIGSEGTAGIQLIKVHPWY